jgi:molybdate transport system ATP-binding protein
VSGGEAQRAALARALAIQPDLLLMDEPFGAVEEALREHLRNELQRLQARFQIPVLLVTHNLEEAYLLADQLLVLERGVAVQSGARDEVFRRPKTPGVAKLMGMSNIFEGILHSNQGGFSLIACHGMRLKVPQAEHIPVGSHVRIGIRPEDVIVIREHRPLQPDVQENLLEGKLVCDRAHGFDHQVTIALGAPEDEPLRMSARIPHPVFLRLNLQIGDRRQISVKPESIHVFPVEGQPSPPRSMGTDSIAE